MSITATDLNDLARDVAAELGVVGAQIALLHRGTIHEGVAGIADLQTGARVIPDTSFQVGSTTKVHTAALFMQLVEEGQVGLDVPVAEQLPGFVLSDAEALESLTPRHLMSMSSGIDNGPYTDYGAGDDALTRYVADLAEIPHVFPPGEGYGYSNASTCVTGRLIEHVTGRTWEAALRERLLEPARLERSGTYPDEIPSGPLAGGHVVDEAGDWVPLQEPLALGRSLGPAGGTLYSTAGDLARFAHLFLHGGVAVDGTRVLQPDTIARMEERQVAVPPTLVAEWWGLGPYGKTWDGIPVVGHSGTNSGGSSYLLWAVEREIAVATVVNTPRLGYPFAARIFRELFGSVAGVEVPMMPAPPLDFEVPTGRLVGRYEMCGWTFDISSDGGKISISGVSDHPPAPHEIQPSELVPLGPTTFLTTDPAVDGGRGWGLAFIGPEDSPATNLINGFFNLRRTGDSRVALAT